MRKKSDNKVKLNEPNISSSFVSEVKQIIYLGRQKAYASINSAMMETYWNIGKRIVLEEQKGDKRAKYGKRLIQELSKELTGTFGKGFSPRYLAYFRLFYTVIPDIKILQTRLQNLTWSHILKTLRVENPVAMRWYLDTAAEQMIRTDTQDYFIDLVFYNVILKCYVLIDLKIGSITHQDVGQMDMYVRMYDELQRTEGDNPTIGIVLCSETSKDIAKYSILKGNKRLFATKYKIYLPTEEQLREEIEKQKQIFKIQHAKAKDGFEK